MKKKIKWIVLIVFVALLAAGGYLAATFQVPEFVGMDGLEVKGMKGKELQAEVKAKIYNANWFGLGARRLDYILTYRDTVIGKGALPDGMQLVGGDTTLLELPVKMDLDAIFAVYASMLAQRKCKLDIHLDGEFSFLKIKQGLDVQAEVEPADFISEILGKSMGEGDVSVEELQWKSTKLKTTELSFVTVIKNPLEVPLTLSAMQLELFTTGVVATQAGAWHMAQSMPLKPQYSTRIPGNMTINHLGALAGAATALGQGELRFDARGKVVVKLAELPFEIPIQGMLNVHPLSGKVDWEAGEK